MTLFIIIFFIGGGGGGGGQITIMPKHWLILIARICIRVIVEADHASIWLNEGIFVSPMGAAINLAEKWSNSCLCHREVNVEYQRVCVLI